MSKEPADLDYESRKRFEATAPPTTTARPSPPPKASGAKRHQGIASAIAVVGIICWMVGAKRDAQAVMVFGVLATLLGLLYFGVARFFE